MLMPHAAMMQADRSIVRIGLFCFQAGYHNKCLCVMISLSLLMHIFEKTKLN